MIDIGFKARARKESQGCWWLYYLIIAAEYDESEAVRHKRIRDALYHHDRDALPVFYCPDCDRVFGVYREDNRSFEEYHLDFPKQQHKKQCNSCRKEHNAEV